MKKQNLLKISISAAFTFSTFHAAYAVEVDINTSVGSQVDWNRTTESVVIAEPTEPVLGHAPGIRTFAKVIDLAADADVDIRKKEQSVTLRMCDTVQINYQILDIDGDWDLITKDRTQLSTLNSIQWFLTDGNQTWLISSDFLDQPNVLKLYDDIYIQNAETGESVNFREWMTKNHQENQTVTLGYKITPYTAVGDPYYPKDGLGDTYAFTINNLQQLFTYAPADVAGNVDASLITPETVDITSSALNLPKLTQGDQFYISNQGIVEFNEAGCAPPDNEKRKQFKIRYFLAEGKNAGKEVSWLASGKKYEVRFFYDETATFDGNNETDITQTIISDTAKDINGKPFINGLRMQLHIPNSVIGLTPAEPGAGLVGLKKVPNNGNAEQLVGVDKPGVPLDEFEVVTLPSDEFFYRNDDKTKLYFYPKETKDSSTNEALLHLHNEFQASTVATETLAKYFDDESWFFYLSSFQGFYFNVTSQIPAYPATAEILSTAQTTQGGE